MRIESARDRALVAIDRRSRHEPANGNVTGAFDELIGVVAADDLDTALRRRTPPEDNAPHGITRMVSGGLIVVPLPRNNFNASFAPRAAVGWVLPLHSPSALLPGKGRRQNRRLRTMRS